MSATDRRDVIDLLSGGHRAVEELFRQLETGGGGSAGSRKSLVDALALELAWHCGAAQRYLLPLARRALSDGDALADRHTAEHLTVEHMVRDLESKDPSDARFEPLLAQLVAAARGHIEHEEQITFAELTRACDRGELLAAGEQLTEARRRAAGGLGPAPTGLSDLSALSGLPVQPGPGEPHAQPEQTDEPGQTNRPGPADHRDQPGRTPSAPAPSIVDRVRAVLAES